MSVVHDSKKCCKCMACLDECVHSAICVGIEGIYIDKDACVECGHCVEACEVGAMEKKDEA